MAKKHGSRYGGEAKMTHKSPIHVALKKTASVMLEDMSTTTRRLLSVLITVLSIVACVLGVLALNGKIYAVPETVAADFFAYRKLALNSKQLTGGDNAAIAAYEKMRYQPCGPSYMTMFEVKLMYYVNVSSEEPTERTFNLVNEYLLCSSGRVLAQAMQGLAIIAVALSAASAILSLLLTCNISVLRLPLSILQLCASASEIAAVCIAFSIRQEPWCSSADLLMLSEHIATEFAYPVTSTVASLLAFMCTMSIKSASV